MATGDFNNDGKLDIVMMVPGTEIGVFLGNGDGTFGAETKIAVLDASSTTLYQVVTGDFNDDGNVDVAYTCNQISICLMFGNGNGTFQAARIVAAPSGSGYLTGSLVAADFNRDGKLDLAVADTEAQVSVFLGTGTGGFGSAKTFLPANMADPAIVVADFNGDGKPDIVVFPGEPQGNSTSSSPGNEICLGNGDGTFGTCTVIAASGASVRETVVGDFNGDGHPDLASITHESGQLTVVLGSGTGSFTLASPQPSSVGAQFVGLAVGDFNGDGYADVAALWNGSAGTNATLFLSTGSGTFVQKALAWTGGANAGSIMAADLNRDGVFDLVSGNTSASTSVILNIATATATATLSNVNPKGSGTHYVDASFPAATDYQASTSGTVALTGTTIATTLTLQASPSSSNYGQQVSLSGILSPYSYATLNTNGEPISFYSNGSLLGSANLSSGVATLQTTSLAVGTDTLTAGYGTDGNFAASSATSSITVSSVTVTATASLSPSSQVYGGTPITATVHVSCNSACGNVDYRWDGGEWGTVALDASGNFSAARPSSDPAGNHTIQINYLGNGIYAAVNSNVLNYAVSKATPTLSWATPSTITYGTALSAAQLNASSGGVAGTFTYTPAAGATLNAGTQTLSVNFTPSDTADFNTATATVSLVVNKAATSISIVSTVNPTTFGQNVSWPFTIGTAYGTIPSGDTVAYYDNGIQQYNTTVGGAPWGGTGLPGGTNNIYAVFQGDANYLAATSNTISQVVNKAMPTITWATPTAITYGTALSGAQLNATSGGVAGTFAYSPALGTVLAAGTQTISVIFTPTATADYNTATASVSIIVLKAAPALTSSCSPTPVEHNSPFTCVAQLSDTTLTGKTTWTLNGAAWYTEPLISGSSTVSGSAQSSPGSYEVVTTYPGDGNHNSATSTTTLAIAAIPYTLSWIAPASISYGTPLTSAQLDATTGGIPGTFTYTPTSGTVLGAGTHTLSVTFTPTDATAYSTSTATVSLLVTQATPTITWPTLASITYGTPLTAAQLDATSSTPGTFAYAPTVGTVLDAGTHTLSVTFTPTDRTNYFSAMTTVSLLVTQATPTINWPNPLSISYGTPLSAVQLDATGSTSGTFTYTPAAGTVLSPGNQTLSITFTPTNLIDYSAATATVPLTVNKDVSTITVFCTPSSVAYNQAYRCTGSVGAAATGSLTWTAGGTSSGTTTLADGTAVFNGVATAGAGTYSVTAAYSGDSNHLPGSGSAVLITTPATVTLNWNNPAEIPYGTQLSATQLNASSGDVPGTFTYTPAAGTILGTGTHSLSVLFVPANPAEYSTATATTTITVTRTPVNISVTSSLNPALFGMSVIFTIDFTGPAGAAIPTGTAELFDGEDNLATVALDPLGHVQYVASSLKAGLHTLTVKYGGDPNYY